QGEAHQAPPLRRHPAARAGGRPRAARLLFGDEEARVLGRAVVGCRVKSGWATAVLVMGPAGSPRVVDRQVLELSDASVPTSRQPYHAVMGARQGDRTALERRLRGIVERVARPPSPGEWGRSWGGRWKAPGARTRRRPRWRPGWCSRGHIDPARSPG